MDPNFPEGLRVLLVDNNPVPLQQIETMLNNCSYHVTACSRAMQALETLRENQGGFDIVICEVDMSEMDGFELLELIGSETDIPVVLMSEDNSRDVVMKSMTNGACDYLTKPLHMSVLMNIWKHVVRKNIKKSENKVSDDNGNASEGKSRVVWGPDLHQKFVDAVKKFRMAEAVPKNRSCHYPFAIDSVGMQTNQRIQRFNLERHLVHTRVPDQGHMQRLLYGNSGETCSTVSSNIGRQTVSNGISNRALGRTGTQRNGISSLQGNYANMSSQDRNPQGLHFNAQNRSAREPNRETRENGNVAADESAVCGKIHK